MMKGRKTVNTVQTNCLRLIGLRPSGFSLPLLSSLKDKSKRSPHFCQVLSKNSWTSALYNLWLHEYKCVRLFVSLLQCDEWMCIQLNNLADTRSVQREWNAFRSGYHRPQLMRQVYSEDWSSLKYYHLTTSWSIPLHPTQSTHLQLILICFLPNRIC